MAKKKTVTKEEPKAASATTTKGRIKKLDSEPGEVRLVITQDAPVPRPTADGSVTMMGLAAHYLKMLEDRGAGPGTVSSYGMEMRLAQKGLGEATQLAELTSERVAEYFASDAVMRTRAGKPKAPPTFLKTQRVLRLALIWAVEQGFIATAPLPVVEAKA